MLKSVLGHFTLCFLHNLYHIATHFPAWCTPFYFSEECQQCEQAILGELQVYFSPKCVQWRRIKLIIQYHRPLIWFKKTCIFALVLLVKMLSMVSTDIYIYIIIITYCFIFLMFMHIAWCSRGDPHRPRRCSNSSRYHYPRSRHRGRALCHH